MQTDPREDKKTMDLVEQQLPRSMERIVRAKSIPRDAAKPQPLLEVNCTTAFNWSTSEGAIIWDSTVKSRLFRGVTVDGVIEVPETGWYAVSCHAKCANGATYYLLRAYKDSVTAANEVLRDARGSIGTIENCSTLNGDVYLKKGESLVVTRQASATSAADVSVESNGSGHTRLVLRRIGA